MKPVSKLMQAKKAKLSRILKFAWSFMKTEKLTLSQGLRKAWILTTKLQDKLRFTPNMFEATSLDIVNGAEVIGSVKILTDGYVQGRNKLQSSKVFRNRHEAIKFALSNVRNKYTSQLPLI